MVEAKALTRSANEQRPSRSSGGGGGLESSSRQLSEGRVSRHQRSCDHLFKRRNAGKSILAGMISHVGI